MRTFQPPMRGRKTITFALCPWPHWFQPPMRGRKVSMSSRRRWAVQVSAAHEG